MCALMRASSITGKLTLLIGSFIMKIGVQYIRNAYTIGFQKMTRFKINWNIQVNYVKVVLLQRNIEICVCVSVKKLIIIK